MIEQADEAIADAMANLRLIGQQTSLLVEQRAYVRRNLVDRLTTARRTMSRGDAVDVFQKRYWEAAGMIAPLVKALGFSSIQEVMEYIIPCPTGITCPHCGKEIMATSHEHLASILRTTKSRPVSCRITALDETRTK